MLLYRIVPSRVLLVSRPAPVPVPAPQAAAGAVPAPRQGQRGAPHLVRQQLWLQQL